jgi:hypothetical protein
MLILFLVFDGMMFECQEGYEVLSENVEVRVTKGFLLMTIEDFVAEHAHLYRTDSFVFCNYVPGPTSVVRSAFRDLFTFYPQVDDAEARTLGP